MDSDFALDKTHRVRCFLETPLWCFSERAAQILCLDMRRAHSTYRDTEPVTQDL